MSRNRSWWGYSCAVHPSKEDEQTNHSKRDCRGKIRIQCSLDLVLIRSIWVQEMKEHWGFTRAGGLNHSKPESFPFLLGKYSPLSHQASSSSGGWSLWSRASSAETNDDGKEKKMWDVKQLFRESTWNQSYRFFMVNCDHVSKKAPKIHQYHLRMGDGQGHNFIQNIFL